MIAILPVALDTVYVLWASALISVAQPAGSRFGGGAFLLFFFSLNSFFTQKIITKIGGGFLC